MRMGMRSVFSGNAQGKIEILVQEFVHLNAAQATSRVIAKRNFAFCNLHPIGSGAVNTGVQDCLLKRAKARLQSL